MVIRQAWESGDLRTLTRSSPLRASGAHVSIIGHISQEELRRELLTTDAASGFGNRFLYACARRSKLLPEGGSLTDEDWQEVVAGLREAIRFGQVEGVLKRDTEARELWAEVYESLSEGRPGLCGAITSRAEAQVMRIAVIYAVLDCSTEIRVEHLRAALAVWNYCEVSAQYIFGDALGDETADAILAGLYAAESDGLSRTAIRDLFKRHKSASDIERALSVLASLGLASRTNTPTGGRSAETWIASAWIGDKSDGSDRTLVDASHRSHRSLRSHSEEEKDPDASQTGKPEAGGSV